MRLQVLPSIPALLALVSLAAPLAAESLPEYKPAAPLTGSMRCCGAGLFNLVKDLEVAFKGFHPALVFDDILYTGDGYVGGLESGKADIAFSDRDPVLTEYLSFNETFGYDLSPGQIDIVTGAFDIKGHSWAVIVFVHKDNPLNQLTVKQLDGIFGSERSGGYRDYRWYSKYGRGPEDNIRTWGQVGLTGDWANHEIHTYGYAPTGMRNYLERVIFEGGDKWNPNYREYVEYGTKMVTEEVTSSHTMLAEDMAKDRYGITWSGIPHAKGMAHLKALALAPREGGAYVTATRETVQTRAYPLSRPLHVFVKHPPGKPVDPKVREFVEFILSRQGQDVVIKNGGVLPLTPEIAAQQRKLLD